MKSRSFLIMALAGIAFASALFAPPFSNGQAAAGDDPALALILTEVTAQQAALADQQARIDLKLATISDNLRQARIFTSRAR